MAEYRFLTVWRIDAPIDRVFATIVDAPEWPRWWPTVRKVEVIEVGDEHGIGTVCRYTFRGWLPYSLVFDVRVTRIEQPTALEGTATGELEGTGLWVLEPAGDTTIVRYEWNVRTTQWWMNLAAPIARLFFTWNHDYVMERGRRGLQRYLLVQHVDRLHEQR